MPPGVEEAPACRAAEGGEAEAARASARGRAGPSGGGRRRACSGRGGRGSRAGAAGGPHDRDVTGRGGVRVRPPDRERRDTETRPGGGERRASATARRRPSSVAARDGLDGEGEGCRGRTRQVRSTREANADVRFARPSSVRSIGRACPRAGRAGIGGRVPVPGELGGNSGGGSPPPPPRGHGALGGASALGRGPEEPATVVRAVRRRCHRRLRPR